MTMTKAQAIAQRRKNERTVSYTVHAPLCLFSDGTIVPKYPCTCGSTKKAWTNILGRRSRKG